MIRKIEALNYRCLEYVSTPVGPFQVLVGSNGSGKSTFLDVVRFISDLLKDGLKAVDIRSPSFNDLVWMRTDGKIQLAVEMEIPADRLSKLRRNGVTHVRYEVAIGFDDKGEVAILGETLWLRPGDDHVQPLDLELFPARQKPPDYLVYPEGKKTPAGWKKVVSKTPGTGNDYFFAENTDWRNQFRLGPQRLALANLPEDEDRFPVAVWAKQSLMEGVQHLVLNSERMRQPSPPGSPRTFQPDGSSLPWAVDQLRGPGEKPSEAFARWIAHARTALADLETVETWERQEDRHRCLRVVYRNGLQAPAWSVSDGTLRLLALTLLAYLPASGRTYLVEEPENGIHPQAVETVFQSLSAARNSQILCATHSPVLLSLTEPAQVLCFARTKDGVTDVRRGDQHPGLKDWKRDVDLGTLFASGVLGV
jgi:predicted ATPase